MLRNAALAALAALLVPLPVAAAPCTVTVGQRVVLAASSSDPSVFVWDSRERLIAYAAGRYGSVDSVVRHAALVPPGTGAIVAVCHDNAVRRRYVDQTYDAVGIKVTSGAFKNRWGWVVSDDMHPLVSSRSKARTRRGAGGSKPL